MVGCPVGRVTLQVAEESGDGRRGGPKRVRLVVVRVSRGGRKVKLVGRYLLLRVTWHFAQGRRRLAVALLRVALRGGRTATSLGFVTTVPVFGLGGSVPLPPVLEPIADLRRG